MALYHLENCELLIFSLVGLVFYGCNQNLHRYVCIPIGGDRVFIAGLYLELLLIAEELCPTI